MSAIGFFIHQEPIKILMSGVSGNLANGTSVTVTSTARAVILGGFPPFTHSWTEDIPEITAQASTSVTTRLQATGSNTIHSGTLKYIVTDVRSVATTATSIISIVQGTP